MTRRCKAFPSRACAEPEGSRRPKRFVVGLTGGLATGKSSALAEFARLGAKTLDLDAVARAQARPGGPAHRAIVRAFGRGVLGPDGAVDRAALGRRVFGDAAARRRLEAATHPLIRRELERRLRRLSGVVVVDVPLLFEAGLQDRFDATLLVACPPGEQARRVARRDRLPAAEIRRRLRAQWPLARKRRLADVVIENGGSRVRLRAQVGAWLAGLKLLHGGMPHGNPD